MPATASTPAPTAAATRPDGEIALELRIAEAARVADEEHSGEIRAGRDEEHADQERDADSASSSPDRPSRCRSARAPTRPRPATVPMKNGVSTEESAKAASASRRPERPARDPMEGESRAAQHDPERGQAERDEQGRHDRREGLGERRPEHHEDEDQPHVVRLPDRPDRPGDQGSRALAALAAPGHQGPEPGAEVGAAEDRVERDARPRAPPRRRRRVLTPAPR